MILRALASVLVIGLLALNAMMPGAAVVARGPEAKIRADLPSALVVGDPLPPFTLYDLHGRAVTREDLLGHRLLLTFERSVDW